MNTPASHPAGSDEGRCICRLYRHDARHKVAVISKSNRFTQETKRFVGIFLVEYFWINVPSALEGTIDINKVELSLFSLFVAHVSP